MKLTCFQYAYDAINVLFNAYENPTMSAEEICKYIYSSEHRTITFRKLRFQNDGGIPSKVREYLAAEEKK